MCYRIDIQGLHVSQNSISIGGILYMLAHFLMITTVFVHGFWPGWFREPPKHHSNNNFRFRISMVHGRVIVSRARETLRPCITSPKEIFLHSRYMAPKYTAGERIIQKSKTQSIVKLQTSGHSSLQHQRTVLAGHFSKIHTF